MLAFYLFLPCALAPDPWTLVLSNEPFLEDLQFTFCDSRFGDRSWRAHSLELDEKMPIHLFEFHRGVEGWKRNIACCHSSEFSVTLCISLEVWQIASPCLEDIAIAVSS